MTSLYMSNTLRNGLNGVRERASRIHLRTDYEEGEVSPRARLINQLVEEAMSPGDFSSYFLGNTRLKEPPYVLTSHTVAPSSQKSALNPPVRIYPSMVGLRWNPYVDVSESDIPVEFNCKCENCTKPSCPSKTQGRRNGCKTNIVKFCDRCTMTPRVNDVACGVCKSITYVPKLCPTSDASDTPCRKEIHINCPQPILRKPPTDDFYQGNCSYEPHMVVESSSRKSFREPKTCCRQNESDLPSHDRVELYDEERCHSRRILYNEGISDSVAQNLHKRCRKKPPKRNLTRECDKDFQSQYCMDGYIPYSHRGGSKYHHDCREPSTQRYQLCSNLMPPSFHACPTSTPRGAWLSPPRPPSPRYAYRTTCLTLPKKVLSSERNIEAFVKVNRDYYRCQVDSQTPFK